MKHKTCTRDASAGSGIDVTLNYDLYYTGDDFMSKENQIKRDIQRDIDEIELILNSKDCNEDELTKLHIKIDGKYQSKINTWGQSCYNWYDKHGFDYNYMSIDSLKHNLLNMKSKLEGYLQTFSLTPLSPSKTVNYYSSNINNNKNNNTNTNTNTNENKIDFKEIEKNINNMESLTSEGTKEALKKLKELEDIYNSKESRKKNGKVLKKFFCG